MTMPRIIPHLWYDDNAREARDFYCRVFHQEQQNKPVNFDGTPSGKVELLEMSLFGQTFNLISAGPYFKFNPSISFLVNCNSEEEVGRYWTEFGKNAHIMMPWTHIRSAGPMDGLKTSMGCPGSSTILKKQHKK
jgi:predicted 3-demethylubiquinone-9 3-methyltransferase (glyoxalase superfamily)